MVRGLYSIHASRVNELNNIVKDAVQYVYETDVKDKKKAKKWTAYSKINATNLAINYVNARISMTCLTSPARLRRMIIDEVETRKYIRRTNHAGNEV